MTAPGRNDPCPCGSGRRFKVCCGRLSQAAPTAPAELRALGLLLERGRPAELESALQQLLPRRPLDGVLWQLLAAARRQQGKDALEPLMRAVLTVPLARLVALSAVKPEPLPVAVPWKVKSPD